MTITDWIVVGISSAFVAGALMTIGNFNWAEFLLPGMVRLQEADGNELDLWMLTPLMALAGAMIATRWHPYKLVIHLIIFPILGLIWVYSFEYSYTVPRPIPFAIAAGVLSWLVSYTTKEVIRTRKKIMLKSNLNSCLPGEIMNGLLWQPERASIKGKQAFATIIYADYVGITDLSKKFPPDILMTELGSYNEVIGATIREFGGTRIRGYHTGIIGIFGDTVVRDSILSCHADVALQCAYKIQRNCLSHLVARANERIPPLTLRIGISSSSIVLGNSGANETIDISVIGKAVVHAQELAGQCGISQIMYGNSTKELLVQISPDTPSISKTSYLNQKQVSIDAFSFDPLYGNNDFREMVRQTVSKAGSHARAAERWIIERPEVITIKTKFGLLTLADISATGMKVLSEVAIPVGTVLNLNLSSFNATLSQRIINNNLKVVSAEVMWASPKMKAFGIQFRHLPETSKEVLLQSILEAQNFSETAA